MVAELRRLDADVVLLQEVDWCHAPDDAPRPFTHDAFHAIASALGLAGIWAPHYAYRGTISPLSFPFPSPDADRHRVSCVSCVRRCCDCGTGEGHRGAWGNAILTRFAIEHEHDRFLPLRHLFDYDRYADVAEDWDC